jgi:hypothetical protein
VPPAGTTETLMLESLALPPSGGAYLAAVVPAGAQHLVIESRWRRGYDAGVPGDAVVIYRVDPTQFDRTAIVDGDGNGDRNDAGAMWLPGETFTDPGSGVAVRVDGVTELGHVVTITRPLSGRPPNTSCLTARDVTALPFKETVSTEGIADEGDLPFAACAPLPARTLWYRLTAPGDGSLSVNTTNSSPAATVTLWLGACDRLPPTACHLAPPGTILRTREAVWQAARRPLSAPRRATGSGRAANAGVLTGTTQPARP